MDKRKISFCLFIIFLITTSVFFSVKGLSSTKEGKINLSAWVVYWNSESALEEINVLKNNLTGVSLFSAYYDNDNKLVTSASFNKIAPDVEKFCNDHHIEYYLTVVNDKINEKGESSLKDKMLLEDILADEQNRYNSIEDIIQLARKGGYDGIEIDYEEIRKDYDLWKNFVIFSKEMYKRADEEGLGLRIILEPSAPTDNMEFPQGPEYIMMAYNLYGPSGNPGPKADKFFIRKLAEKMKNIKSEKRIAFATGGFDWVEGGKTTAVTELQAKNLMLEYNITADRDEESGSLNFKYKDNNGKKHIVWFADVHTLKLWIAVAKEEGFSNFSLWRIGGNHRETLENVFR